MRAKVLVVGLVAVSLGVASCGGATNRESGASGYAVANIANDLQDPCNKMPPRSKDWTRGQILDVAELTSTDVAGQLTGADSYRILYVSSAKDENDLRPVCGTVVMPSKAKNNDAGVASFNSDNRLVSWSHGTVGIQAACQPTQTPAHGVFGPMPGGLGAVETSTIETKQKELDKTGALQTLINTGKVVAQSDYYVGLTPGGGDPAGEDLQPYMAARVAAANSIDMVAAASAMILRFGKQTGLQLKDGRLKTLLWGHSQGGATAMYAGQLWQSGYQPQDGTARIGATLSGISMAAPAGNLIGFATEGAYNGEIGLGDADMHAVINPLGQINNDPAKAILTDNGESALTIVPIGPVLFSQIIAGWQSLLSRSDPSPTGKTPAFDPSNVPLSMDVLTEVGKAALAKLSPLCIGKASTQQLLAALCPFYPAKGEKFIIPRYLCKKNEGTTKFGQDFFTDQFSKGESSVQKTCHAQPLSGPYANWCKWLFWNTDGPAKTSGVVTNPYPSPYSDPPVLTPPIQAEGPNVPIYIAHGTGDELVPCEAKTPGAKPTFAEPCMGRALYRSLQPTYCPASGPNSSLTLQYFDQIGHMHIQGAASQNPKDPSTFEGSPVQLFMDGAFAGTVKTGCTVQGPGSTVLAAPNGPTLNGQNLAATWTSSVVTDHPVVRWTINPNRATAYPGLQVHVQLYREDGQKLLETSGRAPYYLGKLDVTTIEGWNEPLHPGDTISVYVYEVLGKNTLSKEYIRGKYKLPPS